MSWLEPSRWTATDISVNGELGWRSIFLSKESTAALRRITTGVILDRTGSYGSWVGRRQQEISRIVLCSKQSTSETWLPDESKIIPCLFYCSVYICWRISTIFGTEYSEIISRTKVIYLPTSCTYLILLHDFEKKIITSFENFGRWFFCAALPR